MSQHMATPENFNGETSSPDAQQLPTVGKSIAWLVAFAALFYGAAMLYGAYLGVTQPDLVEDDELLMEALLSPTGLMVVSLLQAVLLIPCVLFAAHFSSQHWRDTLAFRAVPLHLLGFWALVYCGYFVVMSVMEVLVPADHGEIMTSLAGSRHLGLFLTFVVVAPVIEELVFRGYLFTAWRKTRLGLWGTVLLTSLIFSLVHAAQYSWLILIYLFVFSIILGLAREKTGSIWTPAILHVLNNAIAMVSLVYLGLY
ncbi:MAG: CPBP family intramembrane metalloprotease [Natronospirillum sp.]|uniref:CPBP family intramembrane glutamic endopeptidase n=1 Tax=Natronospirillum sp. TaxID=2812955 RepID=UPI0025ED7E53|nr:CPBP family intramembrane glutamic endopeptidase [Natronospirillum sp.]MCH8551676.1 CPBP family intramembrane metalloprotease [Natronospirillum sp.]